MHWASPVYINFLLLIPGLILFFIITALKKRKSMDIFGHGSVLTKLTLSKSAVKERGKRILIVIAASFLILALTRPQIGSKLAMTKRYGVDILVAIDTSLSMLAQDIKPNRLEKAKFEITSLIEKLKGDRIGILTFSGDSFIQCPLTLDYGAAKMFLSIIEAGMLPRPGTAIGDAIRVAADSFIKKEKKHKVLILLTDGEDHGTSPVEAARDAHKQGIIVYTIGIGTGKGEPIPMLDEKGNITGYKKDKNGEVVMSRLDEETLQKIALVTGGKYYRASGREFELGQIYSEINKMEKKELSSRLYTQYEERFQYFLGIGLVLLCIEFVIGDRRRS